MSTTPQPRPTTATGAPARRALPTTIWVSDSGDSTTSPQPPAVLPAWALTRIRTEFTIARTGDLPAPLLRLAVTDTAPGMDARIRCATHPHDDGAPGEWCPTLVVLAELHPDTLPITTPRTRHDHTGQGALDDGWPGFFHRAHRLLRGDGLLLLATRQHRDDDRLTDPLGLLIATARTAGFRYLQHIVIVHGHPEGDRLVPTPPDPAMPELIHSDLLVLHAEGPRP
ncbi:hypothetical protein AB0J38_11735 [Streptomyces sp. NPDC050095]|uniref:hypothetical protein n=1 Tax=unclassified Streptomyces TaxID=2593676 RepID=UPI0034385EF1